MGHVFSKTGTDRQKCTLERKNVQRIFCVAFLLAVLACTGVIVLHKDNSFALPEKSFVAVTLYAVGSVAFSCFAFYLLKRKSKKSELWLFQMLYMIANASFLTYISYSMWKSTGSFLLYALVVLLNSCVLLYDKGEYALCAGIECMMPVVLVYEKALVPHHVIVLAAVHLIAGVTAYEIQRGHRKAEEYRRKYIQEVKAAELDPLTKVSNRRGMMRRILSVWPALEEADRTVAVMVVDVDHFKKYNDCFGHPAGDACLCRVADIVRRTIKGHQAFVSRIGGEEFLIFAHGIGEKDAYELAEQIRYNVEAAGMPHAEDAKYRNVTVSIGVATDRCSGEISFSGMYRRADKELYRAKNSGRNRVGYRRSDFSAYSERRVSGR